MNVENRLARLEREIRSWWFTALGLGLLLGASICCTQGTQEPTATPAGLVSFDNLISLRNLLSLAAVAVAEEADGTDAE